MTNLNLGTTYRVRRIDTKNEIIPKTQLFKAFAGDRHIFEPCTRKVPMFEVTQALETGIITDFDKTVLSLIAVFGSSFLTTKTLREMLVMSGSTFTDHVFESCIKRLNRYHLIAVSHFALEGQSPIPTKIISLTSYGSSVAKALGVTHRFNGFANSSAEPHIVKSRAEASQLVCNYLKNTTVEKFFIRPVIVVNADAGAIVRPAASVIICGEQLCFEVPRRHDGWLEDLVDKLERYMLVFAERTMPTVVINGEDEEMNLEIHKAISDKITGMDILYTDDLSTFGPRFKYSLYTFVDGERKCFEMTVPEIAS